jgi:hypothetical protein
MLALEGIRYSAFSTLTGTLFHAREESGAGVFLRLVEVKPVLAVNPLAAAGAPDAQNEKFSLFFSGPLNQGLDQGTYLFDHPGLGRFDMFVVPIGRDDQTRCYYEAVFNRPVVGFAMPSSPVGKPRAGR